MAEARVFVLSGSQVGQEVAFRNDLLIGRSEQAGLPLADATVSRSHARVCFRGGRWLLVDLKSSNGTRLRGRPVTRGDLAAGDEFQVGEVKLRFQVEETSAPPPPAPAAGEAEGGAGPDPAEEIVLEGGEEETPPPPAPSPPPAAPPAGAAGPAAKPPAGTRGPLAGPGAMRRLGGQEVEKAGGGGLLSEDIGQWSGTARFLGILLALGLCAGVAYLCFLLATGF